MQVYVRNNNINQAISVLKRKLKKDGVLKELRDREECVTKSKRHKLKAKVAVKKERTKEKRKSLKINI